VCLCERKYFLCNLNVIVHNANVQMCNVMQYNAMLMLMLCAMLLLMLILLQNEFCLALKFLFSVIAKCWIAVPIGRKLQKNFNCGFYWPKISKKFSNFFNCKMLDCGSDWPKIAKIF